jgi:hypothetical protein
MPVTLPLRLFLGLTVTVFSCIGALASCSEPTSPADPPEKGGQDNALAISLGETRLDSLLPGDTARTFTYQAAAGDSLTAFLRAVVGSITLVVRGPDGETLATVHDSARAGLLSDLGVRLLPSPKAGRHTVRITAVRGSRAVFQFRVAQSKLMEITTFAIGDTVAGHLTDLDQVDEFTFNAQAGDELVAYVRTLAPKSGISVSVSVAADVQPRTPLGSAASDTLAGELESRSSPRMVLGEAGRYVARVSRNLEPISNVPGSVFPLPYEFQLRRVNRAPERSSVDLVAGTTLATEAIDHVGDVDEFTFTSPKGGTYNLSLVRSGAGGSLTAELDLSDLWLAVAAIPADSSAANPSARFDIAPGGTVHVRVGGSAPGYLGPYQLLLNEIDLAPESAARDIVVGDTIAGETIGILGDIDEFELRVPAEGYVNFELRRLRDMGDNQLALTVLDAATGSYVTAVNVDKPGSVDAGTSGLVNLRAGRYRIVVSGTSWRNGYTGAYTVVAHQIDPRPEGVASVLTYGTTVAESLEPPGDVDVYTFTGQALEHVGLRFESDTAIYLTPATALVRNPRTGSLLSAIVHGTGGYRYDLPEPGEYRIEVRPNGSGKILAARGPYRLLLDTVATGPERHLADLVAGDTVKDEGFDFAGDIDTFVLAGTPGQEWTVSFTAPQDFVWTGVRLFDPDSRTLVDSVASAGWPQSAGRFRIPAGGRVAVRVFRRFVWDLEPTTPYTLTAFPVDRRPERVSGAIAIGDVVTGEAVDYEADIDEFTFAGVAGQKVRLYFQTPTGISLPGLTAELFAAGGEVALGTIVSVNWTANLEDQGTGEITLPVTGAYTVRVRGTDDWSTTGQYRFQVKQVP